jgi:hypothetical protein
MAEKSLIEELLEDFKPESQQKSKFLQKYKDCLSRLLRSATQESLERQGLSAVDQKSEFIESALELEPLYRLMIDSNTSAWDLHYKLKRATRSEEFIEIGSHTLPYRNVLFAANSLFEGNEKYRLHNRQSIRNRRLAIYGGCFGGGVLGLLMQMSSMKTPALYDLIVSFVTGALAGSIVGIFTSLASRKIKGYHKGIPRYDSALMLDLHTHTYKYAPQRLGEITPNAIPAYFGRPKSLYSQIHKLIENGNYLDIRSEMSDAKLKRYLRMAWIQEKLPSLSSKK